MSVSRNREKLINAILYFLRETKHCHTLKLFKLLNFADFEHFRQTGRTITGLYYRALPQGPVPTALYEEIKAGGKKDLKAAVGLFEIKDDITDALLRRDLKPLAPFDKKWFSKRELNVLARVAEFFSELSAADMSEFSHADKRPWASTYDNGKGTGHLIPSELALKAEPLLKEVQTISKEDLEDRLELARADSGQVYS
jgi:uncharacterized phage-associated protein